MAAKRSSRSGGEPVLLKKMAHFRPEGRGESSIGEEMSGSKGKAVKKFSGNFGCLSGMLIEQSVSMEQNHKFFCGKMLDGGVEKAHKAVRANELATSERTTGKEIFPDGKKVLDAGLKMRHKSPSRQRVAPTGPRKKLSRNEKNLLTAKTKRRKQLLRAE